MSGPDKRDRPYLADWLLAFESARQKGVRLLERHLARLAEELAATPSETSDKAVVSAQTSQISLGNGWMGRALADTVCSLRSMWHQRKSLRKAFFEAADRPAALVAISTKRLPLPGQDSVRNRLRMLTRAMPGSRDADRIADAIGKCGCILLFEPVRSSSLWADRLRLWEEGIYIVDYAFLAFAMVMAPIRTARSLWASRHELAGIRRRRGQSLKPFLAGFLFIVAYRSLLANVGETRAFFLTSNSFATEVLRATLLHDPQCTAICELLHGVPTLEFEEYLADILGRSPASRKHRFVAQLPRLPLYGAYGDLIDPEPAFAINAAVNRYFRDRCPRGVELKDWIDQECDRLAGRAGQPRRLVVAVTGAMSHEKYYLRSAAFAVERAIIRHAKTVLSPMCEQFVVCYTPHPSVAKELFSNPQIFAEHDVVLYPDTVFTWLIADVCIALYSGALFEAAFTGVKVFTPMRVDDLIYPSNLLNQLAHPSQNEGWLPALSAFLRSNALPSEDDLRLRAIRRASRLTYVEGSLGEHATGALTTQRAPWRRGVAH